MLCSCLAGKASAARTSPASSPSHTLCLQEERTRKKIIVLGSDFKAKLLEVVPLENLPVFLGGTSMCADFKSSIGPWTDKSEGACMSPSNSQLSLWTMGKGISPATPTDSPVAPETARVQVAV